MLINALGIGIFMGLRAMVARFIGAKDNNTAVHVAQQAFVLALIFSIVMVFVGIFLSESILKLLGTPPGVIAIGEPYLRIELVGQTTALFRIITDSSMQAAGDSRNPMKIALFYRTLHFALCPLLIFGWGFIPGFGVNGAAYTGVASQGIGMFIGLWLLISGRTRIRFTFGGFRLDFSVMWRLIKIGIPAALMGLQSQLGTLILVRVITSFGTLALAAYTIAQRLDIMLLMPIWGLGMGAGVLVGQNLGAGQPQRAEKSGWIALGISEIFLVAFAIFLAIWPEPIIRIFSSDPSLTEVAAPFLRIAAVSFAIYGFTNVIQSCINGAGDTVFPLIISAVSVWAIQVPLSIFLSNIDSLNIYGVRWAIAASTILASIALFIYFRAGRWKKKNV
jgi:putative MATE family efflux protein